MAAARLAVEITYCKVPFNARYISIKGSARPSRARPARSRLLEGREQRGCHLQLNGRLHRAPASLRGCLRACSRLSRLLAGEHRPPSAAVLPKDAEAMHARGDAK